MSNLINIESILYNIDEACRNWPEKYLKTNDELIEDIQNLFNDCIKSLIQLSILVDENEQVKQNEINAERIVSKLKELRDNLGDIWPLNMESFIRDIFDVNSYHIEAAEYFHPLPFYPDDDLLVKFYRWSVYDTNKTVIFRYYLEKSEIMPGQPYHVLGKSYPQGHSQIQPFGIHKPDYNLMKKHIIDDLNGKHSSPIISLNISKSES